MKIISIIPRQLKKNMFASIAVVLLLAAVPFTVFQLQKLSKFSAKGAEFSLVPYPGLEWTAPKDYTVSVTLKSQTPDESIFLSHGMSVTATSEENISQALYSFYDKLLSSKQFTQIKKTGSPESDTHWVASYVHEGNFSQIQFYPTPYKEGSYTILLFFGDYNATN
jgi:hypothetical protein